jgi:2-polyprenyl-3-methyl-5-hydroxy-6-metoxy-1,4-benzoquinol methylase
MADEQQAPADAVPGAAADLFRDKAGDWDQRPRARQLSEAIGGAILDSVPLHDTMQVMDFGAGTGLIAGRIAAHVAGITAVDISAAMLEQLAAKPELAGKVDIQCRNILEDPLDRRFDAIVSAMALHHVEDTGTALRCFAQHLVPGGWLALADLDAEDGSFHDAGTEGVYHFGFDRRALQELLERSGFTHVEFRTAHTLHKDGGRRYPVFLVTARAA